MAESISVPALRELLDGPEPPVVIDVRRPQAFAERPETIPGAIRRLPDSVDAWVGDLPEGCQVVAYCVRGHEVSQGVVARLAERGVRASFLEGGIEQWRAAGEPLRAPTDAPSAVRASSPTAAEGPAVEGGEMG